MKLPPLFSSFLGKACLASLLLVSAAFARDARVANLIGSGSATVKMPDGTTKPVTKNMTIPVGAEITTTGVEVFLETSPGALAAIKPNSVIAVSSLADHGTVAETELSLTKGSVINTIDPTKKGSIDYKVRTQRGVAAAKATVYSVSLSTDGGSTSVATLSGTVTLTPVGGGTPIVINLGTGMVISGGGATASAPVALSSVSAGSELATAIDQAVTTVATAVQTNAVTDLSSGSAAALLTAVVNVASQAQPTKAATYTQQAVTAATAPGSAVTSGTGGSTGAAVNTVSAISEAAAKGATETLVKSGNTTTAATVNQAIADNAKSAAATNNVQVSNQAIVNSVQAGASSGTAASGVQNATVPAAPQLTTNNNGANTTNTGVVQQSNTVQTNVDARNVSPNQ